MNREFPLLTPRFLVASFAMLSSLVLLISLNHEATDEWIHVQKDHETRLRYEFVYDLEEAAARSSMMNVLYCTL